MTLRRRHRRPLAAVPAVAVPVQQCRELLHDLGMRCAHVTGLGRIVRYIVELRLVLCGTRLAGAGLDVFEQEPLSVDSPLLSMANVVAVPHIGSATHETRYGMAACAVDNLIDALQGKVEKNCVNPHVAD